MSFFFLDVFDVGVVFHDEDRLFYHVTLMAYGRASKRFMPYTP